MEDEVLRIRQRLPLAELRPDIRKQAHPRLKPGALSPILHYGHTDNFLDRTCYPPNSPIESEDAYILSIYDRDVLGGRTHEQLSAGTTCSEHCKAPNYWPGVSGFIKVESATPLFQNLAGFALVSYQESCAK